MSTLPNLPLVYLNGEFLPPDQAKVSAFDRGFVFGDGVYEVIPVFGGRLFRLPHHLSRLEASLKEIRLHNPLSAGEWQSDLHPADPGKWPARTSPSTCKSRAASRRAITPFRRRPCRPCSPTPSRSSIRRRRTSKNGVGGVTATTSAGAAAISRPSRCWPTPCCARRPSTRARPRPSCCAKASSPRARPAISSS